MLRVMAIGDDGREQLRIWRGLATAPSVLLANNHTLPLLREIDIGRFTVGVFPLVSQNLGQVYSSWAQSSGLAYIHSQGIAHRDAFKNNFLVQFFPESLKNGAVSISKPRVYLIDFEVAVQFPDDCPASERVCTGIPCTGSLANVSEYARPAIPEMLTGEPYDPFKLDVWQLASSFGEFDSTFEPVETLLDSMARDDPAGRLTADEAMARLRAFIEGIPPKALLIPPVIHKFK
ncbi:hypothetical protein K523DRAFT_340378 [Schizophyllum commune Tattone D]|nr:hypothetical protein K525DRAFT_282387 [Schizophyllum commune Loenen D]KAI5836317.1 hypothetical protein K523DRAFT_340378 [Schizophyllum commune Tattone D]